MKNFHSKEFWCDCGCRIVTPSITWSLKAVLQLLRQAVQMPLVITSGFRCPDKNRRVGGAEHSKHREGIAADISTKGWTKANFWQVECWLRDNQIFFIKYDKHIHLDLRNQI